ncbi:hypothetical protein DYB37_011047 [Aphanomyces astaci]|uniref:CENP-V/GFA domain-containing protein n=1 Tax=Aphanomyces astaci TaxID=112090 RepID=A0A3R6ZUT6_APHAT|nr:hypothetical protein DYB35_009821 [Aphanomyces astaci]RHZ10940.1 hypothetical protein DYB37_011047 [Aphanomyces astaci]
MMHVQAHQFLRPKPLTLDEYYRFIVLAPRSLCAFDDSNTFPSKLGRIPVLLAPMTHLQMTSNHTATDVAVYSHEVSATYATQHVFCKQCGIHLFHMELNRNDHVAINVYALETDYIEDLRVVFVPKGAFPIFQRVPSSAITDDGETFPALPNGSSSKQRPGALQQHKENASEFEKQLMLWAQLDPESATDDVAALPPVHDEDPAQDDPASTGKIPDTHPVTLDKVDEK